jgi:signal transduction histidine kinase
LEAAVYFSCVEALQNATKYAGPDAESTCGSAKMAEPWSSRSRTTAADSILARNSLGAGLTNIQDRIGALGGTVKISSRPGEGTQLTGKVPVELHRAD